MSIHIRAGMFDTRALNAVLTLVYYHCAIGGRPTGAAQYVDDFRQPIHMKPIRCGMPRVGLFCARFATAEDADIGRDNCTMILKQGDCSGGLVVLAFGPTWIIEPDFYYNHCVCSRLYRLSTDCQSSTLCRRRAVHPWRPLDLHTLVVSYR